MDICRLKPAEREMALAFHREVYKPFAEGKYASMNLSHWHEMLIGYLIAKGLKPARAWKVALQVYLVLEQDKPQQG